MIKIAVLDDNKNHVENIKNLIKKNIVSENYEISEFYSSEDFLSKLEENNYDIIFLDIILDKTDGIEIGKEINRKYPDTKIIFVSVNPDFFKDVYKVNHSYFLTKEFEEERFADAINKAIKSINNKFIFLHTKKYSEKICLKDVLYFESSLKHTKIIMKDMKVKEYNINLKDIELQIKRSDFIRVHQSFIVNINYVSSYGKNVLHITNGTQIPISRTHLKSAREAITMYLGEMV